jgi:hypothetical protein
MHLIPTMIIAQNYIFFDFNRFIRRKRKLFAKNLTTSTRNKIKRKQ